jgi:uncharacterized protein (DUF486 family)
MKTIILLVLSNVFMNLAWYGHLKFKNHALWLMILVSWGIALIVFTVIAFALFRSPPRWNYCVSYGLIVGAVFFAFKF